MPTSLSKDMIAKMRHVLTLAVECFAGERDTVGAKCFKPKEGSDEIPDYSIGINKTDFTTDNCPTLCDNEMALFMQMKSVDSDLSYIAGIIFSTTGDPKLPIVGRIAEDYEPRWEGEGGDTSDLPKITELLIDCVEDACENAWELFDAEPKKKDE
jgi:hypothetical protein